MENYHPKVSIIIPVYNTEKYLRPCLDSLTKQTLRNIEIICVDDGSTDASLQVLYEYESRDHRIRVFTEPHKNAGQARNLGLRQARGEYLYFLDSDDYVDTTLLEKAVSALDKSQADIFVFAANYHDMQNNCLYFIPWSFVAERLPQKSTFSPDDIQQFLFNVFCTWCWNKIFRHSFIEKYNIVFQEIQRTNDMAFVFQALASAKTISVLKEPLVYYRINHSNSLQQTNNLTPLAFTTAYIETKRRLQAINKYEKFEQSLLNEILGGTIYNLRSVKTKEAQLQIINWIQTELNNCFKLNQFDQMFFYDENKFNFEIYTKLCQMPTNSAGRILFCAIEARNIAWAERDRAFAERNQAFAKRDLAVTERNQAVAEKNLILNSYSYKIGRTITWPFRIRKFFAVLETHK